ncbi:N(2)-fixation sustaining protein CowN [Hydrogenophaga sp. NFH-34]|uniref:N(2)-fixation sustaining protein CowN n=1 Tax=Hydrogenophaga sp. NFH-34 TaxID=2744446 RepID=UPI001F1FFBC5|nr:N(2)-fixation sustaining protein CowN [Hydrogenophaga sp. NFH-34]
MGPTDLLCWLESPDGAPLLAAFQQRPIRRGQAISRQTRTPRNPRLAAPQSQPPAPMHATTAPSDRYLSFKGIDVDGQCQRMMARIGSHTDGLDDPFWRYFFQRRAATRGMRCDDLLLLASFVNPIRELFEDQGDDTGLAWLDQLENECF